MVGTTLQHYRILRPIGSGAMGEVFAAEDMRLHRDVALKILPAAMLADRDRLQRFHREAQVIASLNHPNIVTLYGVDKSRDVHFLTMELVDGPTLQEALPERGFPLPDCVKMAVQLADAISVAHERGIVHRDLKPANVMLAAGGRVKVLDFGLAKARVADAHPDRSTQLVTDKHVVMGTAAYMSPEQAEGNDVDARSDIFSLGVVLYEMATGVRPFTGASPIAVMSSIIKDPVRPSVDVNPALPAEFDRILQKCLVKDPSRRYQSAAHLRGDLENLAATLLFKGRAAPVRRRWIAWTAGAMAAGAAATALFAYVRSRSPAPGPDTAPTASFAAITTRDGIEWFPSFSPDGTWLVYSADAGGKRHIFLQSVNGQTAIDLTKDSAEDEDQPAFSPDGQRIAFRSSRDGGGIFVMGRTGESVRRVVHAGFRPSWSPDGTRLVYTTQNVDLNPQNAIPQSELWTVAVVSGETKRVTDMTAVLPAWSPHDKRIAFTRGPDGIWTVPVSGGTPTRLSTGTATDWNPVWSPDGQWLYFASDKSGAMNLWRVRIDEASGRTLGEPQAVTTPAQSLAHPAFSRDGSRIAYTSAFVTANIEKLTLDPSSGIPRGPSVAVTKGTRRWSSPDPSPDGLRLAFYSHVNPAGKIFISGADGQGVQQITSDEGVDRVPRWSPDGQWLAFFSPRKGRFDVWRVRPDGSDLARLTDGGFNNFAWSPDGRRMAVRDVTTRKDPVIVDVSVPGTFRVLQPLSTLDGVSGRFVVNDWTAHGDRIAGTIDRPGWGIVTYSLSTGRYEIVADFGEWPVFFPDGRRLLFVANGNAFYVVDSRTKEVKKIFSSQTEVLGPPRLSRDGRTAYFTRRATQADVWMMTFR